MPDRLPRTWSSSRQMGAKSSHRKFDRVSFHSQPRCQVRQDQPYRQWQSHLSCSLERVPEHFAFAISPPRPIPQPAARQTGFHSALKSVQEHLRQLEQPRRRTQLPNEQREQHKKTRTQLQSIAIQLNDGVPEADAPYAAKVPLETHL